MRSTPLYGTKTHPLTPHAMGVLRQIARAGRPVLVRGDADVQAINPGVVDRLTRGPMPLCEVGTALSPFRTAKKGDRVVTLTITDAGREMAGAR